VVLVTPYILFALVGLGIGAVYAALAMGLVVVYKGTGVINFAQGAMAMYGAYEYDELRKTGKLVIPVIGIPDRISLGHPPFLVCLFVGVLSAAFTGLVAHFLVFRPLRRAPVLAKVVASVGLMIVFQAMVALKFDSKARAVGKIFPDSPVRIGSLSVSRDRFYFTAIAILIAVGLWAYFRYSKLGLATRAGSENELGASLTGWSPDFLAGTTWIISATLTGVMAILVAPSTSLNPLNFTLYVVPALAVALIGRLSSIGVVCAAGLALGAFQSEISLLQSKTWWPKWAAVGFGDAIPFIVVIFALFLLGRSLPSRGTVDTSALPEVMRPRNRPQVIVPLVAIAGALILVTKGSYRFGIVTSMIITIIALSLVLLTGLVGQISLAQAAFAGSAGFLLAKLGSVKGVPFPLSTLIACVVATALGMLMGIPALRIRGAQLAVVTLAGAVAIEKFVFRNPKLVGVTGDLIPDPNLPGLKLGVRAGSVSSAGVQSVDIIRLSFSFLVLAVLVLVALAVANLARSDTGRAFLAVRSNERAAASAGISVAATKMIAFGMSSFLAGLGGAFIGYSRNQLSADSFGVFVGVSFFAFAYLGGITSISGALVAGTFAPLGIGYVIFDRLLHLGNFYFLLSGVSLITTAILNPQGIAGRTRENNDIMKAKRAARKADSLAQPHDEVPPMRSEREAAGVA
jgi:branched-chain amino acid transport system permease protein